MSETVLLDRRHGTLSWTEVREALGVGTAEASWPEELVGVSTDTRTLEPGDLFFALGGPRFDGHDFLGAAVARGAAGLVVRRAAEVPAGLDRARVVRVDDPLQALGRLGGFLRSRWSGCLVAVTGSFGKTTTKEIIGALLGGRREVLVAPGTENNAIGVPRLLTGLSPEHRFAVVEMGTSVPGEIAHLTRIAEPDVAVITGIGAAHLEGLRDLDGVAREKAAILQTSGSQRVAVLNGDDARVRAFGELARTVSGVPCVYFGCGEGADVRATNVESDAAGMRFRVEGRTIHLGLLGRHNVMNALAGWTVGRELGVAPADLQDRLEAMAPVAQRTAPFWFAGSLVIDDTYNANPPAMLAAIETLTSLAVTGRRILVAGEMKELGVGAEALHREIGKAASDCGIDVLWAIGPLATYYIEGASDRRAPPAVRWFPRPEEVAAELRGFLAAGDAVLIKGSHAAQLDLVTGALREAASDGGR
ncbi:MAG: UDP-N-acetylmuramoyl-tripeptide--D-alanyl-D-alanine ligase [Planctomycetes bacterium]|nr:UDP-N-acetylmuramoyl-tripeptide--D-alanyl-D-alanine ligase [Planctomycetota bacterium]